MAAYNSSLAYKLHAMEEETARENSANTLKVVKRRRTRKEIAFAMISPRSLSAFAIIVMLFCLMIYNRIQLTEITAQLDTLSTEMHTLQSKNTEMSSELEAAFSTVAIAELAEEMGMQKRTEHQTEHIYLYRQDKIERTENTPRTAPDDDRKIAMASLFNVLKEYMLP